MTDSLVLKAWRYYTRRQQEDRNRRIPRLPGSTGIYLSEATGCPRKASLRILKYPASKKSDFSQAAMLSGIKGEEKVILVLEAVGWNVERQHTLQTKYGNGKIDVLADVRDSPSLEEEYVDRPVVVEIKTSTIDRQKWLPQRDHMDQCLLYMGLIGEQDGVIPFGEVAYLLKSDHEKDGDEKFISYPVEWDEARYKYLIGQLDLIDGHVRQGIPVPLELVQPKEQDKPPCNYPKTGKCVYWQVCWGNQANIQHIHQNIMEF